MSKILDYAQNVNKISNDNLLVNGNFDIWQRGSSFYNAGFTADRWYLLSNGEHKVSRLSGNVGLNNANNIIRIQTLSSGSYPVLSQIVDTDSTIEMRGKKATLSFYARKPSSIQGGSVTNNWTGPIYGKVYFSTSFDSIADGVLDITESLCSGTLETSDSWNLCKSSFDIPEEASTLKVEISASGSLNDNSIIELGQAKLEFGTIATSFGSSLHNEELNKCKKYYQKVETVLKAGTGAGNKNRKFAISTPLPVLPRSNNPRIIITKNSNVLIESFNASVSNDAYLKVSAISKQPHSELSLEFIIDDEILYGKQPDKINFVEIIRDTNLLKIDWNPPANSDSTTKYSVLYGTSPNEIVNIENFTDSSGNISGVVDSSPYYLQIYSTNSYGVSALSQIFETAPSYSVPSGVGSLTGTWLFDKYQLSWTSPDNDGGSPVTGYRIDVSMSNNFPEDTSNSNNNSTFYSAIPKPKQPKSVTQTEVGQFVPLPQAIIDTSVPVFNIGAIANTQNNSFLSNITNSPSLYYDNDPPKIFFTNSKFNNELTSTGTYYFRVSAMNLAGTGASTTFDLVKTPPSKPQSISTSVGDQIVNINYLPPLINGGNTISLFNLQRTVDSSFASYISSNHTANYAPIVVTNLTNGTGYYFRLRGYNELGYGDYSEIFTATPNKPVTVPGFPSGLVASWVDDDTAKITWLSPSDDGGSPIINYTLYSSSGSGFTSNLTTSITQNNIPSITLDLPITGNYDTFYLRAKANNSVGSSNYSSTISFAKQAPSTPVLTQLLAWDAAVTAGWSTPISRGSSITGYNLDYSTISDFSSNTTTITTTGNYQVVTSLTNNTPYYFRVRALNVIGTGSYSKTYTTTPVSPYSAPNAPINYGIDLSIYSVLPEIGSKYIIPADTSSMVNYRNNYYKMFGMIVSTPNTGSFIYGQNPYTIGSNIRTAAVHAGVLGPSETGIVYMYVIPKLSYYSGSLQNSIQSLNYNSTSNNPFFASSYYIVGSNTNTSCGTGNNFTAYGNDARRAPISRWNTPSNNGGLSITGYEIQYAANSSFDDQLTTVYRPGNTTISTQCISNTGVELHSRIRAYNATGVSPWTLLPEPILKGLAVPQPPSNFIVSQASVTGVDLSWTAPSGPIGSGYENPSNIFYKLGYYPIDNPYAKLTVPYSGVTSASLSIPGANTYIFSLQTHNRKYFSPVVTKVLNVVPSFPSVTSWLFTTSKSCCSSSAPQSLVNALKDNLNNLYSTFSSCAGSNGAAFITADFGKTTNIKAIAIKPHPVYGITYLNHAILEGSVDGISWTVIKDAYTMNFFNKNDGKIFFGNWNYRYIRLKSSNISCIDLSEFYFA